MGAILTEDATLNIVDNRIEFSGKIDFQTVMLLDTQVNHILRENSAIDEVSFEHVTSFNSTVLALMVSMVKSIRHHKRTVVFTKLPSRIRKLTKISDLDPLLPLN